MLGAEDLCRLGAELGAEVVAAKRVQRGYANNRRYLAELADGRRVFVKQAEDGATSEWLRRERLVYEAVSAPFIPEMVAWIEPDPPMLVLEDLSTATWPPPWRDGTVDAVLEALGHLATVAVPAGLPRAGADTWLAASNWGEVAEDPQRFLALGLCSSSWLDVALPGLLDAADPGLLQGDCLVHLDVRSDNLCVRGDRAVLVDWNWAVVGNPVVDVAFWLPSLHAEGGPWPDDIADVPPGMAALVAGFFAREAGLPPIPQAPGVRAVQRVQLEVALPWAARRLGFPPPW